MWRSALDWLDSRTGYRALLDRLLLEPLPHGTGWFFTTGSVVTLLVVCQFVTGIGLSMYYVPSPVLAYDSLRFIIDDLPLGWLLHGLHCWGASFLVVAAVVHMTRVFLFGSYKAPREVTWLSGVALLLVILGFSLSGYLLPWDQKAYWATTVTINVARSTPLVGEWVANILRGGPDLGALTLGRWFSAHVFLLPATLIALISAHIALMRRHGISGPINATPGPRHAFYPVHVIKDTVMVAAVFFRALPAGRIDENSPHGFRGGGEEMPAVIPMSSVCRTDEPQVRLMDECRWLKGLAREFIGQARRRKVSQLVIYERQQPLRSRGIAGLNLRQDAGDIRQRVALKTS